MPRTINFQPMHQGQSSIYASLGKRNVIRCGRRWGKTSAFETWASNWACRGERVGIFAPTYRLLTPTYTRILKTIRPLVESASKIDAVIELVNGGAVEFWSLDNPDAGRSRWYNTVLVDESSLIKTGLREIFEQSIKPTLLDKGGRAIFAGTPRGVDSENFFHTLCTRKDLKEHWRQFHAPTASNPTLDRNEVANLEKDNDPLVYKQEFLAEFVDWRGVAFFSLDRLTVGGAGVAFPKRVKYVFCTVDSALKDGKEHDSTAVVYAAKTIDDRLIILDWDAVQINSAMLTQWMPNVFATAKRYADECKAMSPYRPMVYIEDKASGITLLQHGEANGWPVSPIDGQVVSVGKNGRALACSGPVWRGDVQLTQHAIDKQVSLKGVAANHLLEQVCTFVLNDKDAYKRADDLADAFMYATLVGLGSPEAF